MIIREIGLEDRKKIDDFIERGRFTLQMDVFGKAEHEKAVV